MHLMSTDVDNREPTKTTVCYLALCAPVTESMSRHLLALWDQSDCLYTDSFTNRPYFLLICSWWRHLIYMGKKTPSQTCHMSSLEFFHPFFESTDQLVTNAMVRAGERKINTPKRSVLQNPLKSLSTD